MQVPARPALSALALPLAGWGWVSPSGGPGSAVAPLCLRRAVS